MCNLLQQSQTRTAVVQILKTVASYIFYDFKFILNQEDSLIPMNPSLVVYYYTEKLLKQSKIKISIINKSIFICKMKINISYTF